MSADTLSLAKELIGRSVSETTATKADLAELRSATKADLAELRSATKVDLMQLGSELRVEIAKLDTKIESSINKLLIWFVGTELATAGIIVAVVKLLPAQG